MRRSIATFAVRVISFVTVTCLVGCAAEEQDFWIPKPTVHWTDLTSEAIDPPINGYHLLTSGRSKGLFPTSIAVTRVAVKPAGSRMGASRTQLVRDPRNEFLLWNKAFDDQMAISSVFPIAQRDLGGAEVSPEQVLSSMRALGAGMGFVYGVNELSEFSTEMIGLMYDAHTGRALAAIHAYSESYPPVEEDHFADKTNLWEVDSRALVRGEFEHLVYRCVRDLISRDEPTVQDPPAGWIPAGPVRPVEWPPRYFRPRF